MGCGVVQVFFAVLLGLSCRKLCFFDNMSHDIACKLVGGYQITSYSQVGIVELYQLLSHKPKGV